LVLFFVDFLLNYRHFYHFFLKPYSNFFAVIPVCLSINTENTYLSNYYTPMSPTINQQNANLSQLLLQQNKTSDCNLLICHINSLQQAKVYRYTSNRYGMILNFDFNFTDGKNTVKIPAQEKDLCQKQIKMIFKMNIRLLHGLKDSIL
jgi:hypothetical protein